MLNLYAPGAGITYDWSVLQGTANIYYDQPTSNQVSVYAYPFARINGNITNRCGSTATTFYIYNSSTGFYAMKSPNPATTIVSATVIANDVLKSVTLINHPTGTIARQFVVRATTNAKVHKQDKDISFDVDDLPRGIYFLNFIFEGNKTLTEQIRLN